MPPSVGKTAWALCGALIALLIPFSSHAEDTGILKNRAIGYVTTNLHWALFQSQDGKTECPNGMNEFGPREIFKQMYPDGTKRSVVGTELERESAIWFPDGKGDRFPYLDATGKIAPGMNLDGKVGPNDFTSPSGERGIDNQLYRVLGCSRFYRGPDGTYFIFADKYAREFRFNRSMIEITNIDNLANDNDVDVTIYRGLDRLMQDASGNNIMPGGTEHIDTRFAKKFEAHLKGKIVDGVLTTEPADVFWMWSCFGGVPGGEMFRGMRFNLKLTPEGATGMIAGYADVENFYKHIIGCQSTHHLSYGQLSAIGMYSSLLRNADGYPNKTGAMTAISSAINIAMAQVFIVHAEKQVAANDGKTKVASSSGQ
jgi:hypothetical protein